MAEFLGGQLVVHRGETLPIRALANSPYAASRAAFEAAWRAGQIPESPSSIDRFVRGAMLASGEGNPVERGFALLASVTHPLLARWSIVYDLGAGEVYFKTDTNAGSGEVAGSFVDYTRAANRALLAASTGKIPTAPRRSEAELAALAAHPDATSSCDAAR